MKNLKRYNSKVQKTNSKTGHIKYELQYESQRKELCSSTNQLTTR